MRSILLSFILTIILVSTGFSQPITLSYQGRLTDIDNEPVIDATYEIIFSLHTSATGGSVVWAETGLVSTIDGLFTHQLGSVETLTAELFKDNPSLHLGIRFDGADLLPRLLLAPSAYSAVSNTLSGSDWFGNKVIETDNNSRSLTIFDETSEAIVLQAVPGDSSLMIPEGAINSQELLNEPGIAVNVNFDIILLSDVEMQDLIKVTIEIPDDGYIVLTGKCYLLLSGTTGANSGSVQIDEIEGGSNLFPYYTMAGLAGYVNTQTNYFPVYVTRTYLKPKGIYTFRLEGRANLALPAQVESWDHILTATYYPTSYYGVEATTSNPEMYPASLLSPIPKRKDSEEQLYKIDFRKLELIESNNK